MFINGNVQTDPIDVTGDGINDLIASYGSGDTFGAIYFYQGFTDSIASLPYDSLYPLDSNFAFGWRLNAGYVDEDSLADLITFKQNTPTDLLFFITVAVPQ